MPKFCYDLITSLIKMILSLGSSIFSQFFLNLLQAKDECDTDGRENPYKYEILTKYALRQVSLK